MCKKQQSSTTIFPFASAPSSVPKSISRKCLLHDHHLLPSSAPLSSTVKNQIPLLGLAFTSYSCPSFSCSRSKASFLCRPFHSFFGTPFPLSSLLWIPNAAPPPKETMRREPLNYSKHSFKIRTLCSHTLHTTLLSRSNGELEEGE